MLSHSSLPTPADVGVDWHTVYGAHATRLHRAASKLVGQGLADDVVQEALLPMGMVPPDRGREELNAGAMAASSGG